MEVVSLFDGMSCLQIALKELEIPVSKYYYSEIDVHAIKQTQLNFPDAIPVGDVTKWREWDIDWSKVDLIGAGSPCQGFSFAGKQLAFDDPRSKLFFEFALILKHAKLHNPKVKFLLENVNMRREFMRIISEYVGIFPVNINSNLVSAQNRDRCYWTNIITERQGLFGDLYSGVTQPKDRGVLLKDILEREVNEKYFMSSRGIDGLLRALKKQHKPNLIYNYNQKSSCVDTRIGAGVHYADYIVVAMRGRNPENTSDRRTGSPTEQRLEPKFDGKTNCITSVSKDNLLTNGDQLRRFTPTEVARLQTIPDWYIWKCSDTQQYKMLGNGWTVEVIKHILSFLN